MDQNKKGQQDYKEEFSRHLDYAEDYPNKKGDVKSEETKTHKKQEEDQK